MKINEIEELLQISRANVRFYEKEGLLHPKRGDNGYRDYSEEDIACLKKIIIFRKLGISIQDIRSIFQGELLLSDVIACNIEKLNQQIEELSGALEICRIMKKDPSIESGFDQERYWNLIHEEEESGQRFAELVKDYIEFEKNSLISMWGGPFLYDLNDCVKHHGWLIAGVILLGICVIRGLAVEFFWKTGSFLYGFTYPFFLFVMITVITFPLFVLNRKYRDYDLSEEEEQKTFHIKSGWKIIPGILYILLLLFGIPIAIESLIFDCLLGADTVYVVTSDMYIFYFFAGMYVFAFFIWLYSKHGIFPNYADGEGIKSHLPRKIRKKAAIGSVVFFLAVIGIYASWYDCFTEHGLRTQRIFWGKEYTWEDVDYYTLSADWGGTLKYTVVMRDGLKADCIGGAVSMSDFPDGVGLDGEEDFGRYLSRVFSEQGIELKVKDWKKLYQNLKYDYWKEYAEDIQVIAEGKEGYAD